MLRILLLAVLALGTALSAPACKKASKDKEAAGKTSGDAESAGASRPATMSASVVATVQLPTGLKMESLAKAVDNMQPGISGMMLGAIPGALSDSMGVNLAGADLNAPLSIIVVDPKKHDKSVALLVKPSDASGLEAAAKAGGMTMVRKNGLALLGEASVVEAVESAAFGSLSAPTSEMVARIYPGVVIKAYREDLRQAVSKLSDLMASQQPQAGNGFVSLMVAYEELIVGMGEQTEFVEVRVAAAAGASDFLFRMQPRAGTTMAALASAQVSSNHALLGKLPADTAGAMLFSGDLRAGAARQPMIDFTMKAFSGLMAFEGGDDIAALMKIWFDHLDGQVAVNMSMDMSNPMAPKMNATYVMGATDADAMRTGWRKMFKLMASKAVNGTMEMMGMKFDIQYEEKALSIDGVEVDRYGSKMNLEALPEEQRALMAGAAIEQNMHFAAFDDVAIMAMGDNYASGMKAAISAARGKTPGFKAAGALAEALERSKSLNESMLMAMDVSTFIPEGMPAPFKLIAMGFGQDKGALNFRMTVRK